MSAPTRVGGAAPFVTRTLARARFETATLLRNGEQLLVSVIIPIFVLVGLTVFLDTWVGSASGVETAAPSALAVALVSSAFTSQSIATGFDRRNGVLRFAATTPLGRDGWLAGKILAVLVLQVLQLLLIGGAAALLGWRPDPAGVPLALLAWALGTIAFLTLGLTLAGRLRWEAVLALGNTLFLVFIALGLAVPVSALPDGLAPLVTLLPSGALGELLRGALGPGTADPRQLVVLLAWGILGTLGVVRGFRWSD